MFDKNWAGFALAPPGGICLVHEIYFGRVWERTFSNIKLTNFPTEYNRECVRITALSYWMFSTSYNLYNSVMFQEFCHMSRGVE